MKATNYIVNFDEVVSHILSCYPNEGGGVITSDNIFHPIENEAEEPLESFEFGSDKLFGLDVKCILHSHTYDPDKPPCWDPRIPSKTDMESQIETDVEWAIVVCEGESVSDPVFWGDYDHRPPLWNREFIHSAQDCLAFMADWQYKEFGLKLPFQPRDFDWFHNGENFCEEVWQPWGFIDVSDLPQQKGDVVFYKIQSEVVNHVGVIVEPNQVAHHLFSRFPKTESYKKWSQYVTRRIRHKDRT